MTLKPLKLILLLALSLQTQAFAQSADPDFKTEEYFHNIYKKYNQQPTSPEAWEKALSNRKASTYTIQNKDTLWDVSQTFFGDSNYWPKVWSYNTEGIQNPHEINPKQAIRFYAGSFEEPPTVGLAGLDAAPEALPEQVIEKREDGSAEAIKIPPPKRKSRPLVRHLPNSIPLYRLGSVNTPPVEFEAGAKRLIPIPKRYLSVYAADAEVANIGEVVETEIANMTSASDFQYITVRLPNLSEKNLVAYDDHQTVKDPEGGANAKVIEIQGDIEVLEKVNDAENVYRAFVQKTVNPVKVGAKLMPGRMNMFDVTSAAPSTSVHARIIGGESEKYQKIFGDDEFIFLSAGAKEGLQVGSTLQVYMNERVRKPKTQTHVNDRIIGIVKVVKLADHFATAFVIKTETDLVIGDYVGGAVKTASASGAAAEVDSELKESEGTTPTDSLMTDPALNGDAPAADPPGDSGTQSDGDLAL
ncbi:MAG: LysM peptidoglycan-binding domain-containing protein [Bdellovibrionaceae bacterium]|nr:LysM peptidoglycan-binding domain-containing protein [Pseudobdellovibrionaceae bacterium]